MRSFSRKCVALLLVVSLCYIPTPASAGFTSPRVTARSAIIMDYYTGRIIYSKYRNTRRLPASTLKLLTAMVALDNAQTSKRFRVSRKASLSPASKIFIRQGETYSVADLVKAIVISSANDAAVCVAEGIAGTEYKFSRKMNAKARSLGCKNSNFTNASGLPDDNQYTTAYDMARITRAAYKYPLIRKYMKSKYESIRRPSGKKIKLKNHNKLLWNYPMSVHGKTGYTRKARHCFACVAQYRNKRVVIVMLKSTGKWNDVRKLVASGLGYNPSSARKASKLYKNRTRLSKTQVRSIQRALQRAGCNPGKADGIFGTRTLNAVMKFQRKYGLSCDGIVGPQTLGKLKRFM
ncbi:peptidoglycan-binding protein [Candidatus Omnitrophota bacterium]